MGGAIAIRLRGLIREVCLANEIQIVQGHISKDHVYLLISYSPRLSVSKIVAKLSTKQRGIFPIRGL
ncbi:MAG: transposase [Chlorobi bacterium]|nr:transposase [Chlorobiota bacterium]